MEPVIARLIAQAAPRTSRQTVTPCLQQWRNNRPTESVRRRSNRGTHDGCRAFTTASRREMQERRDHQGPESGLATHDSSHSQPAHKLSHNVSDEEKNHYDNMVEHSKANQIKSPWMREGSDTPPVARQRSAGAMTKGKLLTTPSRMLKLILPLTTTDHNKDRKDVEPLALLVHPQQPLSYLERLIQSELPVMKDEAGKDKIPSVHFRAEDSGEDVLKPDKHDSYEEDNEQGNEEEGLDEDADQVRIDGKVEKTGKLNKSAEKKAEEAEALPEKVSDPEHPNFVRWSPSTEIGDFIRDAARGKEFSVDIEGAPSPIYVGVPSFRDRTYYLRMRLRKTAKGIAKLADIKNECDKLAHKGAQRVAQGGFAILVGWWYLVYRLTFETELGWDVMEPVTYLVGLSTLIGGYMWFLYHNREVSYKSAMNFTYNKRQSKLYQQRGFDLGKWEHLVEEGNRLRREIKMVADEYDVDWDESEEGDKKVVEALRKERNKRNDEDDDDAEDDKKRKKNKDDE